MDKLFGVIGEARDPRLDSGDSSVDQLNSRHTVFLLFVFSAVVTLKQHYVAQPIQCWHPDHFHDSWEEYADNICWVNSTYFVPFSDELPKANSPEPKQYIGYYQWTSLILAYQAVFFFGPRLFWISFNKKAGMDVTTITGAAVEIMDKADYEERDKILKYMAMHMRRFLRTVVKTGTMAEKVKSIGHAFYGSWLSILYMISKGLYLLNSVGQVIVLNNLLGLKDYMHGIHFIEMLFADSGDNIESPLFPRVAMCDFKIRSLGNIHRYTIQCALPINLFNEKIFIFVWIWLVFVTVANIISIIWWLTRAIYMPANVKFIKTRLITMEKIQLGKEDNKKIHDFVVNYLRRDGLLIVYLVGINATDLVRSELVCKLWDHYDETHGRIKWNITPTAPPATIAEGNENELELNDTKIPFIDTESHA